MLLEKYGDFLEFVIQSSLKGSNKSKSVSKRVIQVISS